MTFCLNDDSKLALHNPLCQDRKHAKNRKRTTAVKVFLQMRISTHTGASRRNTPENLLTRKVFFILGFIYLFHKQSHEKK
jgi:hypothetical protein